MDWLLAEAVTVLSQAIDTQAEELGPELVGRCHKVLVDRLVYDWCANPTHGLAKPDNQMWYHMNHADWQELDRRLFECAGEVARKVGSEGTHSGDGP